MDFIELMQALIEEGKEYDQNGDFVKVEAIDCYKKAELIARDDNFLKDYDEGLVIHAKIRLYDLLSFDYFLLNQNDLALFYGQKVVELFSQGLKDYGEARESAIEIGDRFLEQHFDKLIDTYSRLRLYHQSRNSYYQGMLHYQSNQIETALDYFEESIEYQPNFHRAYYGKGVCYFALKNYQSARFQFEQAIQLYPDFCEAYFYRAQVLFLLDDLSNFFEDIEKCLALSPPSSLRETKVFHYLRENYANLDYEGISEEQYPNLAEMLQEIEELEQATELEAGENEGIDRLLHRIKANIAKNQYSSQDITEMLKSEEKNLASLQLSMKLANQIASQGNLIERLKFGDEEEQKRLLTKCIKIYPLLSSYYYNRGQCFYFTGDVASALSDFSEAIKLDSMNYQAYVERGTAYKEIHHYQAAIEDYEKALSMNPQDCIAWCNLGDCYSEFFSYQFDLDQAISYYSRAIEYSPNYASAYRKMGVAFADKEEFDRAKDSLEIAASLYQQQGNFFKYQEVQEIISEYNLE